MRVLAPSCSDARDTRKGWSEAHSTPATPEGTLRQLRTQDRNVNQISRDYRWATKVRPRKSSETGSFRSKVGPSAPPAVTRSRISTCSAPNGFAWSQSILGARCSGARVSSPKIAVTTMPASAAHDAASIATSGPRRAVRIPVASPARQRLFDARPGVTKFS
jgi:hypothetical protein